MGRMYSVPFAGVAVTAQQDFFELTAAAGKPLAIHSIEIEQVSEVGDAAEEGLQILLKRGSSATTSGSGGTAPTPQPVNSADAAAGFTAEVNNTTKMSGGTIAMLRPWGWNVRIPFNKIFAPETRPIVAGGERLTVELATTPADSITVSGVMLVEELA